jgi:hypothetical protein
VIAVGALLVMVCVLAYSQLPLAEHDQQHRLVGSTMVIPSIKTNTAMAKITHSSRNLRKSTPAAVHGAGAGGVRGLSRLAPAITNSKEDQDMPSTTSKISDQSSYNSNNNSLDEDYEEERVAEEEELLELEKADPAGHSHILLDMTRKKVQEELKQEEPPEHAFGLDDRDESDSKKHSKSHSKTSEANSAFGKDEVLVIPRKRDAGITHSYDKKARRHSVDFEEEEEEEEHSKRTRSQALEISAEKLTSNDIRKFQDNKSTDEGVKVEVRNEYLDEKSIRNHHEHIAIAAEE